MKCVLATANQGKWQEIQRMLAPTRLQVLLQSDFNVPSAAETAVTFIENALIKARHAAKITGLPAIADDSGIEVDFLAGAPGVYSARYAGTDGDDQANNQKLLQALDGVPSVQRTARYHCLIVFLRHADDPVPIICQGTWEGQILLSPKGDQGFGYDPLFLIPELQCSAAELTPDRKNQLSHRGQALKQLAVALSEVRD